MTESLKKKTGTALFWSFTDKGGQQVIQLIFGCILARLLSPDEFGLIAVLAIFTAVAAILQESGFSSALIRKKTVSQDEYSTVFYFNIFISIFIYFLFFLCAPLIGDFYDKPILTNLSRFIFLAFVFNAFGIIQNVNLVRNMDFQTNTRITLVSGILSGGVAIAMAFNGFGVWSLAAQLVMQSFIRTLLLWLFIKWVPIQKFTISHLSNMGKYSVKLLLSAILNQVCSNIYSIIIGKHFSLSQAGLYSQAYKLNVIPQSVISDGIKNVALPMFSKIGDDVHREKKAFRKIVRITSFITFPVALILMVMAKPIITILLSAKWIDAIPILQILAISGAIYPLYVLIGTFMQHRGKSGKLLYAELIRNILLLTSIFFTFHFGVLGLVTGISCVNIFSLFVCFMIAKKDIQCSLGSFVLDIIPYVIIACVAFIPTLLFEKVIDNTFILLAAQLITGSSLYLFIVKISGSVIMKDSIEFFRQIRK